MVAVGERLPDGALFEHVDTEGCAIGTYHLAISELVKEKRIVIFGVPGAFTPLCSSQHAPGYIAKAAQLKSKGVDEIWCVSVNDAFVMHAWSLHLNAKGQVRFLADGSAEYVKKLGIENDQTARGMGIRSRRFSMLVEDGIVRLFNLDQPGMFAVSNVETILSQA